MDEHTSREIWVAPMACSKQDVKQGKAGIPWWVSWLIYAALSVGMTWPLAQHLNTRLSGNNQDLFNVYWGNWWVPRALAMGKNPYLTQYLDLPGGFRPDDLCL